MISIGADFCFFRDTIFVLSAMKKIFTCFLLILPFVSYGQKSAFKEFKLLIIKPDTAIIDSSLQSDTVLIKATYQKRYENALKSLEKSVKSDVYPPGMEQQFKSLKEKQRKELTSLKAIEPEVRQFKYFQLLSAYSAEVYNFYFNEYEPFSTISEIPSQKTDLNALKQLTDTSKADYVIFFSNIRTESIENVSTLLKVTTSLFSKKDSKVILTQETEGDAFSRGEMWTCQNRLSCLFINSVRTSTKIIAPVIAKRQKR